jgi:SAM-dependent MidA family methyltransferase
VDFTAAALAGDAAGLKVAGFTTQAQFLLSAHLDDELKLAAPVGTVERIELAQQVKQLVMPGEMGERFKVMALTRSLELPPTGFAGRDLRHLL